MADIFLSYAREDRDTASSLVAVLADCGWSVFWDHHIPTGKSFDRVIEEQLDAATCVIVMWSRHAVASDWVRAEAREGARRQVLRPVQIDETTIPLEFRHLQTVNLSGWRRGTPHAECDRLLADLAASMGRGSAPPRPPEPLPIEPFYRRRHIQAVMASGAVALALAAWSFGGRTPGAATDSATPVERPLSGAPSTDQAATDPDRPAAHENAAPARSDGPTPKPTDGSVGRAAAGRAIQLPSKSSSDKTSVTKPVETKEPVLPADGEEKAPPPIVAGPIPDAAKERPAPPPVPGPVADETTLRESVRAYAQALSSGSREAVRAVFPSVTDSELREVESLRNNFGRDRYFMNIIILKSQINGRRAEVRGRVFHNGIDDSGKPFQRDREETLTFDWNGSTWIRVRSALD